LETTNDVASPVHKFTDCVSETCSNTHIFVLGSKQFWLYVTSNLCKRSFFQKFSDLIL